MIREAIRRILPSSHVSYNLPDKHWFDFLREGSKYSPDAGKLEEYKYQLYFAADETKARLPDHRFIEGSDYQCPAFTQQSFNFWNPQSPLYPVVAMRTSPTNYSMTNFPPSAKIKGEVYAIRPQRLLKLDIEKENGVQFQRERVRLVVPFRKLKWIHDLNISDPEIEFTEPNGRFGLTFERLCVIRAWMYVGIPDYWDRHISLFDYNSVQTYISKNRRWCPEYYNLRK